ncbi:MAG: tRNA adenosine(34) deaminase TadA [Synergistaceae bacterium]|nr:tRNA adenosine(34) deaminase TadA [Synergistaceae bacterium]MBQ6739535.1 tRNA adenosine(34) deaminase TadA [Synergistaceae bacterium]
MNNDIRLMREAILKAHEALARGDIPVGAVIVNNNCEVIGSGCNIKTQDPTAHAEIQAIREACKNLNSWNLSGCELYVTLEPCAMCAGACVNARLSRVVFGAYDYKAGAGGTLYNILQDTRLNHRCEVKAGVLKDECLKLLQDYFFMRRNKSYACNLQ